MGRMTVLTSCAARCQIDRTINRTKNNKTARKTIRYSVRHSAASPDSRMEQKWLQMRAILQSRERYISIDVEWRYRHGACFENRSEFKMTWIRIKF